MERKTALLIAGVAAVAAGGLLYANRTKVARAVDMAIEYALDINQRYHIAQLHPSVRARFIQFIAEVEKLGYKVVITSSYRSFAEQAVLHAKDAKNAASGSSEHNYGFALDINIQKGLSVWKKGTDKQRWVDTGIPALALRLGLSWGGYYKSYYDPVHFAVRVDTKKLKQVAIAQQGPDINKIRGNEIKLAA